MRGYDPIIRTCKSHIYLIRPNSILLSVHFNQGVPFQGAKQKALSEPFLFCPDPLIRINTNSSASKKAVLCSQNYVAISLLVNKFNGSNEGKSLVKIYAIDEIRSFLSTNNSLDAYDLVILPLPGMEK